MVVIAMLKLIANKLLRINFKMHINFVLNEFLYGYYKVLS